MENEELIFSAHSPCLNLGTRPKANQSIEFEYILAPFQPGQFQEKSDKVGELR